MISRFRTRGTFALPATVFGVMLLVAVLQPVWGARGFDTFDIYNAFQGLAGPALLALGLGLTMMAGEFDLSTLGMYALGGMVAVKLGGESAIIGVFAACAVGIVVGVAQGTVVARTGINSMALTLGGYIVLLGLTGMIGKDNSVSYTNASVPTSLDQTMLSVFSPRSLITIATFALVALLLVRTRIGRNIRALGGDRRASRAAGVPVGRYLPGIFAASGALSALGGALVAYSTATAASTISLDPLVFAVTAILLGGVSLAGGTGGAVGIAAGAVSLGLLTQILAIQAAPAWAASVVLGSLLVAAVAFDARDLRSALQRFSARRAQ